MFGMTLGTLVPARKRLLAFVFALMAAAPIAARADDGLVDVRTLPRLDGAVEDVARTEPHSLSYGVPIPATVATPAIEKLLAADGWMQYSRPLEASGTSLWFKRGRQVCLSRLRRVTAIPTNPQCPMAPTASTPMCRFPLMPQT